VGVLTLKKKDPIYYGQLFTLKGTHHQMYLIDEPEFADQAHERILSPYELNIEEGRENEKGNLFGVIESNNGFISQSSERKMRKGK
jgi:hypothetical protein